VRASHDPKPEILPVDERRGQYALRWIGSDGQPKTIVYTRPDRIDAQVSAQVGVNGSAYRYVYRVRVLPSSAQNLLFFLVQNFARDARALGGPSLGVQGPSPQFPSDNPASRWLGFSTRRPGPGPGTEGVFEVESPSPPGLVECRISGTSGGLKGVGEELPPELAEALLGYEAWPHGHTIGPTDELTKLDPAARVQRLQAWLPAFERLGWMTEGARQRYERTAQQGGIASLLPLLTTDAAAGQVTSEVVAVVQGLAGHPRPAVQ
jgi:hypothetical protein